jgi:pyruvate ferredoxin oxidoreductase alpha subunit
MSMRDAGWIMLFAETNQEAVDLHIQAFRLAEQLSCPIMVCMDGFILTHAYERLEIPDQAAVDAYLPPFVPRQVLDPADPYSIGAMVGPEAFTEVRYLAHDKQLQALDVIPEIHQSFKEQFGRESGGLFHTYHVDGAPTVVVTMGSLAGTLKDAVDELALEGPRVGVLTLSCYRPFPRAELRQALERARRVIVVEKAVAPGAGGVVSMDLRMALQGVDCHIKTVIAGLGGRPVTSPGLQSMLRRALKGELADLHFLDLNRGMVDRELARQRRGIATGPVAENLLKDVATHGAD